MDNIKLYEVSFVGGPSSKVGLTSEEWFAVFVKGDLRNGKLIWIQPEGDESKRVIFAENLNGPQLP